MQAQAPEVSSAEASTTAGRTRPPLAGHRLDMPSICDICGKARSTRKHAKCSRLRQQRKNAEWAALLAENAAKKLAKEARHAR